MPFTKVGKNSYVSPSGRKFTKKQVIAYYASDGFKSSTSGAGSRKKKK